MKADMEKTKIYKTITISLIILSIVSLSAAVLEHGEIEFEGIEKGEVLWEQQEDLEEVTVTAKCEDDEIKSLKANDIEESDAEGEEEFSFDVDPNSDDLDYGEYEITLDCQDKNNSITRSFYLYSLEVTSSEYSEDVVYHQDVQELNIDYELHGPEDEHEDIDLDNFELVQPDFSDVNFHSIDRTTGSADLVYELVVSDEEEPGDINPFFELHYPGDQDLVYQLEPSNSPFELEQPWDISINERFHDFDSGVDYSDLRDANGTLMTIEAEYRNEEHSFWPTDFYVEIEDEEGNTEYSFDTVDMTNTNNGYEIGLNSVPSDLDIGEYVFEIGIDTSGKEENMIKEFDLFNYVDFEGRVVDHHEDGVDTEFQLSDDSDTWMDLHAGTKNINADGGFYSASVLPGSYNMSMTFEDNVLFHMEDVELREDGTHNINFDTIPRSTLDDEVEGVNVINAAGILFGYGFEQGTAQINYEHGDVTADNARILKCEEWYMSRDCESGWERMSQNDIEVNPTDPNVQFPVEPRIRGNESYLMTGYALVENTDLVSDIEVESNRVPLGDSVNFEGDVTTPSGESVEDVDVTIEVRDGEEIISTQTTQTNTNGVFGATVSAPDTEGTYDIRMTAEKEPYNPFEINESGVIDTFVERSVDVSGSDQIELPTGQTVEEEYTVINDGQSDLEDISMYLNGISNEWYDIQGIEESLDEGSSFTATIEIEAPEDYFSEENLENENFDVEVRAMSDGEEINTIFDGVATITNEHIYQEDGGETSDEDGVNLEAPDVPTGDFLAAQSSLNIALALITIFTLVLATAVKKKKEENDSDRSSRNVMNSSGNQLSSTNRSKGQKSSRVTKPKISSKDHKKQEKEQKEDKSTSAEKSQTDEKTTNSETQEEQNTQESVENDSGEENHGEGSETSGELTCDVCGEEFDTESGLELHKKALH